MSVCMFVCFSVWPSGAPLVSRFAYTFWCHNNSHQQGQREFYNVAYTQTDPPGAAPDRGRSLISTTALLGNVWGNVAYFLCNTVLIFIEVGSCMTVVLQA